MSKAAFLAASLRAAPKILDATAAMSPKHRVNVLLELAASISTATLFDESKEVAELRAENERMRDLIARSSLDCVHCGLPAADMSRCAHGFPGCARADDFKLVPGDMEADPEVLEEAAAPSDPEVEEAAAKE